jgi:hypothetical protein
MDSRKGLTVQMIKEMSEEENQRRYDEAMALIRDQPKPRFIEYWTVQYTGWSGGISWFEYSGSHINPHRYSSAAQAIENIEYGKTLIKDDSTKWRYTHTTVDQCDNKVVTTTLWTEV